MSDFEDKRLRPSTDQEVMRMLHAKKPARVRELARKGVIPNHRTKNGHYYFTLAALQRWIDREMEKSISKTEAA
jgi:hypothetical protein